MIKQLEILEDLYKDFKQDSSIESILLCGSVAQGTASEVSDLDLIVVGQKNTFTSHTVDDILVEIHYNTYEKAIEKLKSNPMEVYKYLDAKIEYDSGTAKKIIEYAQDISDNFCISQKEKADISYWLESIKIKLKSAFLKQDTLLSSYILATNT